MPIIKITSADLQRAKNKEPGWYGSKIVAISPLTASAKGDSMNMVVTFAIDNSEGKTVDHNYNSKGWIGVNDTHKAITGKELEISEGGELNLDTDEWLNKQLDIKLYIDNYGGRLSNKIEAWLPYHQGQNQKVPF